MNIKELMIGDWVICNHYLDKPFYHRFGLVDFIKGDYDFCEPIPLTPEILEKNEFKEEVREGDPTFPYSAFILEEENFYIEITWYDSHDKYESNTGEYLGGVPEVWTCELSVKGSYIDIQRNKLYVHQLQHALRLLNIEKEIEL